MKMIKSRSEIKVGIQLVDNISGRQGEIAFFEGNLVHIKWNDNSEYIMYDCWLIGNERYEKVV